MPKNVYINNFDSMYFLLLSNQLHLYHSAGTFSLLSHSYLLALTRSHEALSTRTRGLHFVSLKPCQGGHGALTGWQSQHPAQQQNPGTATRWRPRSLVGPCQRRPSRSTPQRLGSLALIAMSSLLDFAAHCHYYTSSPWSRSRCHLGLPFRCPTSLSSLCLAPSSFWPQHLLAPPRLHWYGALCIWFNWI
jgi:hypothetical protein